MVQNYKIDEDKDEEFKFVYLLFVSIKNSKISLFNILHNFAYFRRCQV